MSEQNKKDKKLSREEWQQYNELSEVEKKAMEARFSEEAFETQALKGRTFLESEEDAADLLAELDAAISSTYKEESGEQAVEHKVRRLPRWFSYAAAILIVVLTIWWLWPGTVQGEQLYADYFQAYPNELTITSMGSNDENSRLSEIMKPYNAKRYEEAVEKMAAYLNEKPEAYALQLYYGISLLETQQPEKAILAFERARQ